MCNKISDILSLMADMESCIPVGDSLTDLVRSVQDDELSEAELNFVSAAGTSQSFAAFKERFRLDSEK